MIYAIEADSRTLLFRLDAGELDHLGPRLDFVGDDLTEIGRRADKHRSSEFSELRLYLGIGQASIDFRSPHSPARNRPQSGGPATRPIVLQWLPPARAACRSVRTRSTKVAGRT